MSESESENQAYVPENQFTAETLFRKIKKPSTSELRAIMPKGDIFDGNNQKFNEKSEVHGFSHIARVIVLQEIIGRLIEADGLEVDRTCLRWAASFHDIKRFSGGNHAEDAADWIESNGGMLSTEEQTEALAKVIRLHDKDDSNIQPEDWSLELRAFKDADALDLPRVGIAKKDLRLRTPQGRQLMDLAERLLIESSRINSGNVIEDVLSAAESIGLVEKSEDRNPQDELIKENSFIAHGLSGNFQSGRSSNRDALTQILDSRYISNPASRRELWGDYEESRYRPNSDAHGDQARIYGYIANKDVGLGGSTYLGDSLILIPSTHPDLNGAIVGPDTDWSFKETTAVQIGKYDQEGKSEDLKVSLKDCLLVISPQILQDRLADIEKFCITENIDPVIWIRHHVIISNSFQVESDLILKQAIDMCHQSSVSLESDKICQSATNKTSQHRPEVVIGSKVIVTESRPNFDGAVDSHRISKVVNTILDRYASEAPETPRIEQLWGREYVQSIKTLLRIAEIYQIDTSKFMEIPWISSFLKQMEQISYFTDGRLDEIATLNKLGSQTPVGKSFKLFGFNYKRTETGWEKDRRPPFF